MLKKDVWVVLWIYEITTCLTQPRENEDEYYTPPMRALGGNESKKGKWLEILTQSKQLTRLPVLLSQIKGSNNW